MKRNLILGGKIVTCVTDHLLKKRNKSSPGDNALVLVVWSGDSFKQYDSGSLVFIEVVKIRFGIAKHEKNISNRLQLRV